MVRPRGKAEEFEKRRHQAVAMVLEKGKSQADVARELKVTPAAVSTWVRWHRGQGKRTLKASKTPGRPQRLSAKQVASLRERLLKGAQENGFANDLWTAPRIQRLIRQEYGVTYHLNHVPKLLRKMGFSPQRPIQRATERDEAAIRTWVTKEWPRVKKKPKKSAPRLPSKTKAR